MKRLMQTAVAAVVSASVAFGADRAGICVEGDTDEGKAFCKVGEAMTRPPYFTPAPGRDDGRLYYYIPKGVDCSRPSALLVFLHGGMVDTPDYAPGKFYLDDGGCLMPAFKDAPFIVAAPSAPPSPEDSRWNQAGVWKSIDATIEDAKKRFNIDPDRIFLGGQSMGCFGAYHLGQVMADRFAGVWCSSGGWWETDFRAFLGTPVFIQHGKLDCAPHPKCHPGSPHARPHNLCGVDFARAAHELMTRDGVDHVYVEHSGGHFLSFPEAQDAMRKFFDWARDKRRQPHARRCALVTPCGTRHPGLESVTRTRWLELVEAVSGRMEVDAIILEGPNVAVTEKDFESQSYRLERHVCPQGVRIIAENLGGNRFKVESENVRAFRIYLSPQMGDLNRSFMIEFEDGKDLRVMAKRIADSGDYTAVLSCIRDK